MTHYRHRRRIDFARLAVVSSCAWIGGAAARPTRWSPMISVVIPTYNEAAVIAETLRRARRALEASSEPFELIVVDDSSTDGTAELAESLAPQFPVRVLRRPGRLGLATAVVDGWK